ncbi:MAG: low affinity iron permease family protein [Devosia sp.]
MTSPGPGPFVQFSHQVAQIAGRPITFATACILIVLWAVVGPIFHFSETWQLVVNTATTIITFLMVFVLQNTQNRDGEAVQAKLDELIYALKGADNHFVAAEKLGDKELKALRDKLALQCEQAGEEIERRGKSKPKAKPGAKPSARHLV